MGSGTRPSSNKYPFAPAAHRIFPRMSSMLSTSLQRPSSLIAVQTARNPSVVVLDSTDGVANGPDFEKWSATRTLKG
jgi:hypothetical protein